MPGNRYIVCCGAVFFALGDGLNASSQFSFWNKKNDVIPIERFLMMMKFFFKHILDLIDILLQFIFTNGIDLKLNKNQILQ